MSGVTEVALKRVSQLGFFIHTPAIGGAERYCRDLIIGTQDSCQVTVFHQGWPQLQAFLSAATSPSVKWVDTRMENGAETRTVSAISAKARQALRPLSKRIVPRLNNYMHLSKIGRTEGVLENTFRDHPVDVMHVVNGGLPGSRIARHAAIVAHRLGVRTIMSICSSPLATYFLDRPTQTQLADALSAAIVPSVGIAREVETRLKGIRTIVIPWGVPQTNSRASHCEGGLRSELGITENAFVVGMVGRLAPEKNHQALIRVAARIASQIPNLRVLIAGEGPEREYLEQLAKGLQLEEVVHFAGYQPDLSRVFASLDLVAVPSLQEGLPYVLLEALSFGLPVVSTNVGAIPEYLSDNDNSLLIDPGSNEQLETAIKRLIMDRALLNQLAIKGQETFHQFFDINTMLSRHFDVYESKPNALINA